MARLGSNGQILELHIRCRECRKEFDSLLAPGSKDLTISCPFCSNLALAIIEDFSLRPGINADREVKASSDKKRKLRI
ncbi:MAG: hypothetical protein ACE5DW_04625 [Thermodesulfobacteriota bacterium]